MAVLSASAWSGHMARTGAHPGAWRAAREVELVLLLTFAYFLTRGLIRGRQSVALEHARQVLDIEQVLHLDPEALLQHLALAHAWLMNAANFFYLFGHLPVLIGVAVWLFWTRPAAYRWFRNAFLVSAALGLSVYVLLPVAPPRYLPGFTDTLKVAGLNLDGSSIALFYNPYAAMPSLHVGWALLAGIVLVVSARAWWLRAAGALLPVLMTFTVLMTGNHFLLDVVAGGAIAGLSLLLSAWWMHRRDERADAAPSAGMPTGGTRLAAAAAVGAEKLATLARRARAPRAYAERCLSRSPRAGQPATRERTAQGRWSCRRSRHG